MNEGTLNVHVHTPTSIHSQGVVITDGKQGMLYTISLHHNLKHKELHFYDYNSNITVKTHIGCFDHLLVA